MLTMLGSIVNMIRRAICPLNKRENVHFDNEQDIHMTSENSEANRDGHNLDLLIISHWFRVSHPTRSGCREKSIHLRPTYLTCPSRFELLLLHNMVCTVQPLGLVSLGKKGTGLELLRMCWIFCCVKKLRFSTRCGFSQHIFCIILA